MKLRVLGLVLLILVTSCTLESNNTPRPPQEIEPSERWIEVDLPRQVVTLHDGKIISGEFPASTGVNTSPETTTYTGLFHVQQTIKGPIMSVPGVFVSAVVVFDLAHGNAIHSLPRDAAGNNLDETLGQPRTAGCVRVADSAAVFDFAEMGMPVWVH